MTIRILILSLCFGAGAAYLAAATETEPTVIRMPLAGFPMQVDGWRGQEAPLEQWIVDEVGVDDHLSRYYVSSAGLIGAYIGYYETQRQGKNIHSPLNCLPGAGWNPMSRSYLKVAVPSPNSEGSKNIEINRLTIQKGMDRQVVLYWYQSHGRSVASEYWGKIYTVLDAIRVNRTDAAMIRVISPVKGSGTQAEETAEAAAVKFVQAVFPLLSRHLPE
jgi:EpsI family protein